jgi:hypothetical protein
MKYRHIVIFSTFLLATAVAAFGGIDAEVEVLGFSENGDSVAFQTSWMDHGIPSAITTISFVDVVRDDFAHEAISLNLEPAVAPVSSVRSERLGVGLVGPDDSKLHGEIV